MARRIKQVSVKRAYDNYARLARRADIAKEKADKLSQRYLVQETDVYAKSIR